MREAGILNLYEIQCIVVGRVEGQGISRVRRRFEKKVQIAGHSARLLREKLAESQWLVKMQ